MATVLAAESDRLLREAIVHALARADFTPLSVGSGEGALTALLLGLKADALVVDMNMPLSVGGWMLAQWFGVLRPGRRLIYTSSAPLDLMPGVPNSVFLRRPFLSADLVRALGPITG